MLLDYKTDHGRQTEAEYRKQLIVYYHVAQVVYPNLDISATILCTETGQRQKITPLTIPELEDIVVDIEQG